METHKTSAGRFYCPELDVVRFLAFLLVFLDHTLPQGGDPRVLKLLGAFTPIFDASARACRYGLSLFFTLSAFLICELLLREGKAVGTVSVKQFYIRRILRIWPLYYLALTLGVVVALLPGAESGELAKIGWFAVFMGAWQMAVQGGLGNPIAPLWSISVEEQFYLVAPWVVKYLNRKSLYGFCAFILVVSNSTLAYLGAASVSSHRVWFDAFVQFECFAAGILLCLVLNGRMPRISLWMRPALLVCALCCWFLSIYSLHAGFGPNQNPGGLPLIGGYALAALGSVLVLVAFLGVRPDVLPAWAVDLGRISFGLYVYHEFTIHLVKLVPIAQIVKATIPNFSLRAVLDGGLTLGLPLGLTIVMAALSYRYFETPFLKMKKRHAIVESQPILGAD
jgi:peptidoglycan/LPS O-acetylase OafA/YrhL